MVPSSAEGLRRQHWNEPEVLELVARARQLRHSTAIDSTLHSYQAQARGYVYFLFDRPDNGARTLAKVDQIALDVFWRAPNATKQRIVGQRDEKVLPTDIRYHLDHLTIVQDDFGDLMRMGGGDEVEAVSHPVGPEAEATYDYLLTDSLTLSYEGGTVRVYEIRVRPKAFDRPGFVGSIYVDRANAAIVRMSFSFTPASYVDPYLDYIRVSLDNSLWLGRYWLPYRQEVEIRREVPILDIRTGSVIRGRFEIGGYELNGEIPPSVFSGGRVSAVSPAERRSFQFERSLYDDIDEEGLDPTPSLDDVRAQVREVVRDRTMSGLAPLRLHFDNVSSVARYNRAEGLRVGGGFAVRPGADVVVRLSGGYAIADTRPSGEVSATGTVGGLRPTLDLRWDILGDVGGYPGASTLENTISSVTGAEDFLDPFFRRGVALTLRGEDPAGFSTTLRWEDHRSARDAVSDDPGDTDFRPVRTIEAGRMSAVSVRVPLASFRGGQVSVEGELGRLNGRSYGSLEGEGLWTTQRPGRRAHGEVLVAGGALTAEAPPQSLYLMGGRKTLPGHDYRSFVGDRYWLLRTEGTIPLFPPYVGVRAVAALGATYLGDRVLPPDWESRDSEGLRASIGAGLSFGWDTLRIDLARGVPGGGWEAVFSVAREFASWL